MASYTQLKQHSISVLQCFLGSDKHMECEHRGSYMSAHVLLNLLNELRKRDKIRGLWSILSLFRNEFTKFNNTGAWMLDSIYHMTLRLRWYLISGVKKIRHNVSQKSVNH